jgi:large subunit ribosomal protein L10
LEGSFLLKIKHKKDIVGLLKEEHSAVQALAVVDYSRLSSNSANDFRAKARERQLAVRVVKNRLMARALKETSYDTLIPHLKGQILYISTSSEASAIAKLLVDFIKKDDSLQIKALIVDGELYLGDCLKEIAAFPTKEQALATVLRTMNAPVGQCVRTMQETYASFIRVMSAIVKNAG